MKKRILEKLTSDLFGRLESNRIPDISSSMVKGGETATSLCKTSEEWNDRDETSSQEKLADPSCKGTLEFAP